MSFFLSCIKKTPPVNCNFYGIHLYKLLRRKSPPPPAMLDRRWQLILLEKKWMEEKIVLKGFPDSYHWLSRKCKSLGVHLKPSAGLAILIGLQNILNKICSFNVDVFNQPIKSLNKKKLRCFTSSKVKMNEREWKRFTVIYLAPRSFFIRWKKM